MRRLPLIILSSLALLVGTGTALARTTSPGVVKASYVYAGKTAQGIPVRLAKAVKNARWFRYRAKMTCNDGSTFLDDFFSDDVTIKNNRFSLAYTSNAGAVSTKVTGSLTGIRASGTIRIVERFSEQAVNGVTPLAANGAIVCDSKTVKWTASA